MKRREAILDLYNLALGAFLFISPWLFGFAGGIARRDAWASGALLVVCSAAAVLAFNLWEERINLLVGIWLVLSPWILGFAHTTAMHVQIGVGLVVMYLSALELWIVRYETPHDLSRSPALHDTRPHT